MRLYDLNNKSLHELKTLRTLVETSNELTVEEKDANLLAINTKIISKNDALVITSEFDDTNE